MSSASKSASAADDAPISDAELGPLFSSFPARGTILLAVSGGADSTALLVLARRWQETSGGRPALVAAAVDHGLRPGSREDALSIVGLAERMGVPHRLLTWLGPKPSTGIEASAREARYRLLAQAAHDARACAIATAHTLDDQAETVLLRLSAGSGPAGLASMREVDRLGDHPLLRPFLGTPKGRLVATLMRDGVNWREDPMNDDLRFARARLRRVRDALGREGLSARRLARLASRMARWDDALEDAAAEAGRRIRASGDTNSGPALAALPEEVALRVLRAELASHRGGPIRLERLEALWTECRAAIVAGTGLRRTLAGALVTLTADGSLQVIAAPERRGKGQKTRT